MGTCFDTIRLGIFKIILSFFGDWTRRRIPQAGLLGSPAGLGITLLPEAKISIMSPDLTVC